MIFICILVLELWTSQREQSSYLGTMNKLNGIMMIIVIINNYDDIWVLLLHSTHNLDILYAVSTDKLSSLQHTVVYCTCLVCKHIQSFSQRNVSPQVLAPCMREEKQWSRLKGLSHAHTLFVHLGYHLQHNCIQIQLHSTVMLEAKWVTVCRVHTVVQYRMPR